MPFEQTKGTCRLPVAGRFSSYGCGLPMPIVTDVVLVVAHEMVIWAVPDAHGLTAPFGRLIDLSR